MIFHADPAWAWLIVPVGVVSWLAATIAAAVEAVGIGSTAAGVIGGIGAGALTGAAVGTIGEGIRAAATHQPFNPSGVWQGAAGGGLLGGVTSSLGAALGSGAGGGGGGGGGAGAGAGAGTEAAKDVATTTVAPVGGGGGAFEAPVTGANPVAGSSLENVGSIPAGTGAAGATDYLKQGVQVASNAFKTIETAAGNYGPGALKNILSSTISPGVGEAYSKALASGVTNAAVGAISNPNDPGRGALVGAAGGLASSAVGSALSAAVPIRPPVVSLPAAQPNYTPNTPGPMTPGDSTILAPQATLGQRLLGTATRNTLPSVAGPMAAQAVAQATQPQPPMSFPRYNPNLSLNQNVYGPSRLGLPRYSMLGRRPMTMGY